MGVALAVAGLGRTPLPAANALANPTPVRLYIPVDAGRSIEPAALGAPAIAEGAFVSAARGRLARGSAGHLYFVFDADARGQRLPGMILLPSPNLVEVEAIADSGGENTRMEISGRVFQYSGLNYLIVTAPPVVVRTDAPPPPIAPTTPAPPTQPESTSTSEPIAPTPVSEPGTSVSGKLSDDPSIAEIVADLDRAVGTRRDVRLADAGVKGTPPGQPQERVPGTVEGPGSSPPIRPIPGSGGLVGVDADALLTGSVLVSRRGRVVRTGSGLLAFVPDASTGAPGVGPSPIGAGPMTLLPCRTLAAIESRFEADGERTSFTMSGQVFAYRGRVYLLPTFQVPLDKTDIVLPIQ